MKKLVLIDGHAVLHRAYHAYPHLTTSKGELVNAVYGFTNILLSALKQFEPEYVVVAFDKKAPTFRHKEFKEYKAHRPEMDEELSSQIPRVYEVVKALNIPIFAKEGYEADDVIGTLALQVTEKSHKSTKKKPIEVIIVTGDNDILQILDKNIKVFMPGRGRIPSKMYDNHTFKEKYQFNPRKLIDYKAMVGDSSDNIPGVKGIGPKTAKSLIIKFGSVERIYDRINVDKAEIKPRVKTLLKEGVKSAQLSKKLATIDTKVPIKLDLKESKLLNYNRDKAKRLFEELEFKSLINKLPGMEKASSIQHPVTSKKKDNQMELF